MQPASLDQSYEVPVIDAQYQAPSQQCQQQLAIAPPPLHVESAGQQQFEPLAISAPPTVVAPPAIAAPPVQWQDQI